MSSKTLGIIVITSVFVSVLFCQVIASDKAERAEEDFALWIYLPREMTIKDDTISLGRVSIIRGEDSLVAKASEIALGRISVPGQKIIIDRPMVLSRLACNGIPASTVRLSGAEKIKVKQQQQIINGTKFLELARSFLEKNPPDPSLGQLTPMWIPKDLVLPDTSKNIKLSTRLVKGGAKSRAKVQIGVLVDGKRIGAREVPFRVKYNCRTAVSLVDIPAGASVSAENVKIEKSLSNYPEPANWNPPYGLVVKRRIPANTTIRPYMVAPDMVAPANPVVIVKRNQTVVIRIEIPGLLITAMGKAMQNGRSGEYIKVQNVDSRRIIYARVNEDGTVQPLF